MNSAVYLRTLKDQARIRTYAFILILMAMGFMAAWGPLAAYDAWTGESEEFAEGRESIDGAATLAVFLGFPVFNAKLILILFAILTSVSATATEWQNRTMFLLFSKPVPRGRIVLAKVLGAYTWVVIGLVMAALAMLVGFGFAGMDKPFVPEFFIGMMWVILAMLPFVTISCLVGIMLRKSIPAVFLCLVLLGLVAPVVGQAGFFIAMEDEEFASEGVYPDNSWDLVYQCSSATPFNTRAMQEANTEKQLDDAYLEAKANYAKVEECRQDAVGEVDKFYEDQGAPRSTFSYEYDWCQVEISYEAWDGQGNEPAYNRTQPDWSDCNSAYGENSYNRRAEALRSKFERPLVDAPRYLSPATSLSGWQPVAGWSSAELPSAASDLLGGQEILFFAIYRENAVGASAIPASVPGAILGLVLHGTLWPVLAIVAINRRDLS